MTCAVDMTTSEEHSSATAPAGAAMAMPCSLLEGCHLERYVRMTYLPYAISQRRGRLADPVGRNGLVTAT